MTRVAIDLPGRALNDLNVAHHRVIAARMRHGLAVERYDREFMTDAGVSRDGQAEMVTATAVLELAENEIRRAVWAHGVAIGAITSITLAALNETGPAAGTAGPENPPA